MNVYDFDDTIYSGDSTKDFYMFCLRKQPKVLFAMREQAYGFFEYKIKKINKTQWKEKFFSFLLYLNDRENVLKQFWVENRKKIKQWYIENKSCEDIIISASPEFLLLPIKEELGIKDIIATKVNINTGKIEGMNCRGIEKVKRFRERYKEEVIHNFYSDSNSDVFMAEIAEHAFKVRGLKIENWKVKNEVHF